jgi:hypothetical protein
MLHKRTYHGQIVHCPTPCGRILKLDMNALFHGERMKVWGQSTSLISCQAVVCPNFPRNSDMSAVTIPRNLACVCPYTGVDVFVQF